MPYVNVESLNTFFKGFHSILSPIELVGRQSHPPVTLLMIGPLTHPYTQLLT